MHETNRSCTFFMGRNNCGIVFYRDSDDYQGVLFMYFGGNEILIEAGIENGNKE